MADVGLSRIPVGLSTLLAVVAVVAVLRAGITEKFVEFRC